MQKRNLLYLSIMAAGIFCFSYAQAALHFLPRYQGSYGNRNQEGGRDKTELTCATFGGVSKGANQVCSGKFERAGFVCYTSCECVTDYKWSGNKCILKTCSDYGYLASKDTTKSCTDKNPRTGLTCYSCVPCDTTVYKYSCSGGINATTQSGTACNSLYDKCSCVANASWNATSGKCECNTNYKVSGTSCVLKTCSDYGYLASADSTKNCTSKTPRTELTCYSCVDCESTYKYNCSSITNASGGDGSSCGGKYQKCKCNSLYRWDNGSCVLNCTRNSCSSTKYPLTATSVSNAASYETCTPSCSDESKRYRVASCNSGYTVNSSGTGCEAVPTKTCSEVLSEDGYIIVNNSDDLAKVISDRESEYVLMNDITYSKKIYIYGYVFTPEYFNSRYSQCSGTPTLSTNSEITIDTGGDYFGLWPNMNADTITIYDNENNGTVAFYGSVDTYNIYSEETGNIQIYGNLTVESDFYLTEGDLIISKGASIDIDPANLYVDSAIIFKEGSSATQRGCYEGCSNYIYTVNAQNDATYNAGNSSINDLPFTCTSQGSLENTWRANCKGNMSFTCTEKTTGNEVDLSYCQNCGTVREISATSISSECRQCTLNSEGYCTNPNSYVKCAYTDDLNVSSDRYDYIETYYSGDNCGKNTIAKKYVKIKNCYESCNDYGASVNSLAAEFYGYSSEAEFYSSGKIKEWCEDYSRSVCENNNRLDPICDYDGFCSCFYSCSDKEGFENNLTSS